MSTTSTAAPSIATDASAIRTRLGSTVGMLTVYGAALRTAAAAVLIYRAISLWVPTLVGTIAYVLLRGDLKRPIAPPSGSWRSPELAFARDRGGGERLEQAAAPAATGDGRRDLAPDFPTSLNFATRPT